jgi:hypothetical protein
MPFHLYRGPSTFPRARNQFSALEHDDGLLEYPEDIFATTTLNAPIDTALANMERLGQKRAEKIAGLRIEEKEKEHQTTKQRDFGTSRVVNPLVRPSNMNTQ